MTVRLIIKIIAIILWLIEGFIMFERKEKLTKRDCFFCWLIALVYMM